MQNDMRMVKHEYAIDLRTWRWHQFGILGEAALRLHAHFEGVQRMDCSLAGCARNGARQDVACRLGVDLPTHTLKHQLQSNTPLQRETAEAFRFMIKSTQ